MENDNTVIHPFMADIMTRMLSDTQNATNRVVDNLEQQLDTAHARIEAIRVAIDELLSGPYMPMPHLIAGALYPSEQQIDTFRKSKEMY